MGNLPRTASHERTASDEQLADDHACCLRMNEGGRHGS